MVAKKPEKKLSLLHAPGGGMGDMEV